MTSVVTMELCDGWHLWCVYSRQRDGAHPGRDGMRSQHASLNNVQFQMYELFVSGIFHVIFSNHHRLRVIGNPEKQSHIIIDTAVLLSVWLMSQSGGFFENYMKKRRWSSEREHCTSKGLWWVTDLLCQTSGEARSPHLTPSSVIPHT